MSICLFLINKVIRNQNKTCYHFQDCIGHVILIFLQNIDVQNTYSIFTFRMKRQRLQNKDLRQRKILDF